VADFVGARYGKSERVAALVCVIAVVAALPYIALQLKAVSASVQVLFAADTSNAAGGPVLDIALVVAILLAGFSVAFGTRHADATEHQNGMVLAIAVESLVKLGAFLLVGFFVVYGMFAGFTDVVARLGAASGQALDLLGPTADPLSYGAILLISAAAALVLPRQFHMMVVENRGTEDLRRAIWLFPLYLVAINVFVVPLALAGLHLFPGLVVDRDMTVLLLPLQGGSGWSRSSPSSAACRPRPPW
jgi:Na+/proline symporter